MVSSDNAKGPTSIVRSHPLLYHYTSQVGLEGIIKSNALWATYFDHMNDAHEIREAQAPLVDEIARRLTPFFCELRRKGSRKGTPPDDQRSAELYAEKWGNALYDTVFPRVEKERTSWCCITSFCSHAKDQRYEQTNGLLSQWRAYGRDGYCLVFDTAKLSQQLEHEGSLFMGFHTGLYVAHYPLDGAPPVQSFIELIKASVDVIKGAAQGNADPPVDALWLPFIGVATAYKHRGFFEEREVRLVTFPATELAYERMKGVKGYKELPLKETFTTDRNGKKVVRVALFGEKCDALPIQRIIVGPSASQSENATYACKLVGGKIPVTKSATPFVG